MAAVADDLVHKYTNGNGNLADYNYKHGFGRGRWELGLLLIGKKRP
jgi:hypothetical protein